MRAFIVDARHGDEPVRACVEQANTNDRVVLIADSESERRAGMLGLRSGLVFAPAALRHLWPAPPSSATRSLRACLLSFHELIAADTEVLDAVNRACGSSRALPPRRLFDKHSTNTEPRLNAQTPRSTIRTALATHPDPALETVIALAADPDDAASACDFVRVCQTLSLVGHRVTAVVPRRARELSRAKEIIRTTGIALRLVTTEAPVWSLLPGMDAAVIDAAESPLSPMPAPRARRWMARCCAACGIPAAVARSLVDDTSQPGLALADSRLPVHIARTLDAALRACTPRTIAAAAEESLAS